MVKFLSVSLLSLILFSACSTKEINNNVDSITSDITNAFEGSKDKSAE